MVPDVDATVEAAFPNFSFTWASLQLHKITGLNHTYKEQYKFLPWNFQLYCVHFVKNLAVEWL